MRTFAWVGIAVWLCVPGFASAGTWSVDGTPAPADPLARNVSAAVARAFAPAAPENVTPSLRLAPLAAEVDTAQGVSRTKAFEYSDGYRVRAKIHRYASFATLPLFGYEFYLGNKLFNLEGTDSTRSMHGAVGAAIGGLFAVNTVTGVWNLMEARKDPHMRTRRMIHAVLMLVADAGFAATGALAPDSGDGEGGGFRTPKDPTTHRNVAYFSMGTATIGYLMMLLR